MLVNTFKMHSSNKLSKGKRGREETRSDNLEALRVMQNEGEQNVPFSMGELRRALAKTGKTAPGKDEVHYSMLKQISKVGKMRSSDELYLSYTQLYRV